MKLDSLRGETAILAFKLTNGNGWITTHRLIFQRERHNPRYNIMEKQEPEIFMLQDLKKTEIKGDTLTAFFKGRKKAKIELPQQHTPEQLQEVKDAIEQVANLLNTKIPAKKVN